MESLEHISGSEALGPGLISTEAIEAPPLSAEGSLASEVAPSETPAPVAASADKQLTSIEPADLDRSSQTTMDEELANGKTSASTQPPDLRHAVHQSLARLEMNSLQVKLYLDSIDEKISRMEPHLEGMRDVRPSASAASAEDPPAKQDFAADHSPTPSAGGAPPSSMAAAAFAPSAFPDRRRASDSSIDDRRRPPRPLSPPVPTDEEPWAWKPWLLRRRRQLAIAAAVLVTFLGALFTGSRPAPPAKNITAVTPASAVAPVTSPAIAKTSAAVLVTDTSVTPPSSHAGGALPPLHSSLGTSPGTGLSSSRPAGDPASLVAGDDAAASPEPAAPLSPLPSRADIPGRAASLPAGRVHVSSGVMAGNLIYSQPPRTPGPFARLFRVSGKVTMQAVIARNGRVENLRVLSGHRMLRGPAQDAVRTWRYRPYTISGVPVEVATIVSVEFRR